MSRIDNYFSNSFSTLNKTNYLSIIIYIVLLCYIACFVYKLPEKSAKIFNNIFVKLGLIAFSAYLIHKDVPIGILFALAVLATIHVSWHKMHKKERRFYKAMIKQRPQQLQEQVHQLQKSGEQMETMSVREESVEFRPEMVNEIKGEIPNVDMEEHKHEQDSDIKANYHNSFYPQYANMKPDAYMARYTGDTVGGYDSTATYSKI